jgi:hypothetical protein
MQRSHLLGLSLLANALQKAECKNVDALNGDTILVVEVEIEQHQPRVV